MLHCGHEVASLTPSEKRPDRRKTPFAPYVGTLSATTSVAADGLHLASCLGKKWKNLSSSPRKNPHSTLNANLRSRKLAHNAVSFPLCPRSDCSACHDWNVRHASEAREVLSSA